MYACALKREVCGQLLKDFTRESRLSTESIEEGREERRASYDYASATQPYWANRDTVGSVFFFVFFHQYRAIFFPLSLREYNSILLRAQSVARRLRTGCSWSPFIIKILHFFSPSNLFQDQSSLLGCCYLHTSSNPKAFCKKKKSAGARTAK